MKILNRRLTAVFVAVAVSRYVEAATIAVNNSGFEDVFPQTTTYTAPTENLYPQQIDRWWVNFTGSTANNAGFNSNTGGSPPEGTRRFQHGFGFQHNSLRQLLSTNWDSTQDSYTLTIAAQFQANGGADVNFDLGLYSNGSLVGNAASYDISNTGWVDYSVTVTQAQVVSANANGTPLEIRIDKVSDGTSDFLFVDNVRLVAVPEPVGSLWSAGVLMVAVSSTRLARRRRPATLRA